MNIKKKLFKLVLVKKNDIHINALYELLKKRKFNISNQKLPAFNEHKFFVINNPYRLWYLIEVNNSYIGTMYLLKDNCIGLFIEDGNEEIINELLHWVIKNIKPLPEIKSVRAPHFHINLAPNNKTLALLLLNVGAVPIQVTYSLQSMTLAKEL